MSVLDWNTYSNISAKEIEISLMNTKKEMPSSFWVLEGETEHGAIRRAVPAKDGRVIEIYDGDALYDSLPYGEFMKNVLDSDWKLVDVKRVENFDELSAEQTQVLIDGIDAKIKTYQKFISVSNDSSFYMGRIDALQDIRSEIVHMTRQNNG
jgi:hypothetical protein